MKHRSAKFWRRVSSTAAVLTPAFVALDSVEHFWPQLGLTAVGGTASWYFGRKNARTEAGREQAAHHPDYAKIRRLEIELGLVERPKPEPIWPGYPEPKIVGSKVIYPAPPPAPPLTAPPAAPRLQQISGSWDQYLAGLPRPGADGPKYCPAVVLAEKGRGPGYQGGFRGLLRTKGDRALR